MQGMICIHKCRPTQINSFQGSTAFANIQHQTDPGEACPMMEWGFNICTDPREECPMMEWCLKKITDPGEACPMME